MRLVTWNCHGGFTAKRDRIAALSPDVAIICETTEEAARDVPSGLSAWTGALRGKGVAVICWNGWQPRLPQLLGASIAEPYFLPVVLERKGQSINLIAAWVKRDKDYVRPTLSVLEKAKEFLARESVLIVGDFNQSVYFDRGRSEGLRFSRVLARLEEKGIKSAWHARMNESHGQESIATYFYNRRETEPFHIDFVFGSQNLIRRINKIEIGSFESWVGGGEQCSDHAPIIADFEGV